MISVITVLSLIGLASVILALCMLVAIKMKCVSYAVHIHLIRRQYQTVDGED